MAQPHRLGLIVILLALLLSTPPVFAQTGTPTVIEERKNIYLVDGTKGSLPNLLPAEDVEKIVTLRSAGWGTSYRVVSPVSPDDQAFLAAYGPELFLVNVRDGGVTPVTSDQRFSASTNYVWLDDYTLGFLTITKNGYSGGNIDRRTGRATIGEPRLSKAVRWVGEKQVPILFSPNHQKLLLLDTTDAKPASFPSLSASGQGDVLDPGFTPLPSLVRFLVTEGARFKVVDVDSGVAHEVLTVEPNTLIADVTFSQNGDKFSLTSWSIADTDTRSFDGVKLTEFGYRDATGNLAPEENIFLQSNAVTILDFPSGVVRRMRAAESDGVFYTGTSWSTDNQTLVVEVNTPGRVKGRRYPQYYPQFHAGGSLRFFNSDLQEIRRLERPELDTSQKRVEFVSPDEVIIQTRYGTNGHPYYYNLRSGEFRNIADRAGVFLDVVSTNRSREIVFVYSSFTDPPEYYRMRWDGTAFAQLTWRNDAVRNLSQARQYGVSFTLRNGERFEGVLILPADVPFPPRQVPIVVWQPGGPTETVPNSWRDTVEVPTSLLPNFGFGVLVTPLYGRYGFGPERFQALADGNNFGQIDIDAQAEIVAQLRARGWASKVGIAGCSYGGYFVTQSVTRHPNTYDAAHTMCSIVDVITEWSRGGGELIPWLQGRPIYAALEEYRRDSPIYQVERVRTPLLAFHGTKDFLPVAVMENFMSQVIATGTPARLLKFQDAYHNFGGTDLTDTYELYGVQEQVLWFRRYLGQ
ncbi:MAG: prolyl oligopeptidase family serine peptidase [Oscillochloridaceae bacterium]|nr:prolyl oligopeptidase family serine peptidase [Chloroflexaceae bacterium]MDW8389081.1 prolyl oligopeptidase family serine peptidase [Oscillochloridaceae bacterium]